MGVAGGSRLLSLARTFLQRCLASGGWNLLAEGRPPLLESGTGDDVGSRLERKKVGGRAQSRCGRDAYVGICFGACDCSVP